MASPLSLSSLRLLVPPLHLLTAAMWHVARQQSVKHYGMLEDFVAMVTEVVPQLLTDRQRQLLLLALRAKATFSNHEGKDSQLGRKRPISEATQFDDKEGDWRSALVHLSDKETLSAAERQCLLQEVFDNRFDSALLSLMSDFLSRIEQLFPVPDFKQTASWLDASPTCVEDCLQEAGSEDLRELLTNQSSLQGRATTAVGRDTEKILLAAWSHPLFTKLTNCEPPREDPVVEADIVPEELDVELVKVEVVVMTEDEQDQVEEDALIGQNMSPVQQEASNDSPAGGGDEHPMTPVMLQVDGLKASPGNFAVQSEDRVGQSDAAFSEVTANALFSISHNSQRVAHKCPQCSKCFIYRSQVIRHLRTNKSCGAALTSEGVLNLQDQPRPPDGEPYLPETRFLEPHLPEPRLVRSLSCFQCNAVFKTKPELLSHQRSHRARPVYQCSHCDKDFHHLSSLTNHKQTHLARGRVTFSSSDQVFETAKERDSSRLQQRPPELTCTVCEQTFSSQTQLLRHLQTHSVEGATPQYTCRFCDQSFSGVTQLRIHQRSHTHRSYQCDLCSKTYGSLTGLQSHRASHSAESRFLCPQCGKRFKTRDGLEGHLRTHTGERPYRCPYCPKDFTALAGLNVHVRRHTGERPYVCTVCGKGWPSGGDLQKHMRTHTGERPYICADCGKAFSISCHLTEHRRIHTGEKPFSCPECGKCLRRKFDLKKHMLSHNSVRPYACIYCTKSYTRKTHLNRHLLTHSTDGGGMVEVANA